MAKTEKYTVEQMKQALSNPMGSVSQAANALGCTPQTVRNYMKKYPELEDVVDFAIEKTGDFVESKLIELVKTGNVTAIIFYCKTKLKSRGYVERQEYTGPDGNDIEFKVKFE